MEYRRLGDAGVQVSRICLGTANFGGGVDEAESIRLIHYALDQGINFVDTANTYTGGQSEEIVGKALKDRRNSVVLATKVRGRIGEGPNQAGLSRYHIMQQIDGSLRRLQTDHIDLYQVHSFDPDTPLEETLQALNDLVQQGKVRYIGCSNFAAWQLLHSLWISDVDRLASFVSVQPLYNLLDRGIERELLPACKKFGIGVVAYSPLAGGVLSGKYRLGAPPPGGSRSLDFPNARPTNPGFFPQINERNVTIAEQVERIAKESGHTATQLALAWVLANPMITSAILGARNVEQFQQNEPAFDWHLSSQEMEQLNALAPLP